MSITDKLQTLKNTKQAIKQALIDKGIEVSDTDAFASYADKINTIKTGENEIVGINLNYIFEEDENGELIRTTKPIDFVCNTKGISAEKLFSNLFSNSNVISVSFPELLTIEGYMGLDNAFSNCDNLTSISFPKLTTIYSSMATNETFNYCTQLTSVSFPELTTILSENSQYMFGNCTLLKSVSFPKLETIMDYSMYYCFYNCPQLTSVSFPKLKSVGEYGLANAFAKHGGNYLKGFTSISFPELTTIGKYGMNYAFDYNTKLTSVSFPELTTIDKGCFSHAFRECKNLFSLDLPKLSGTLGKYAFEYNEFLQKIWIPKEVTTISASGGNESPFFNCSEYLVIYTDATEKMTDWETYWNYSYYNKPLTVVYGAAHEDFENAPTYDPYWFPSLTENGTMGGDSFAVESSELYDDYYKAFRAFVHTGDYCYLKSNSSSLPAYLTFYNPTPMNVIRLGFYSSYSNHPVDYIIQGSNDNTEWVNISTITNNTAYGDIMLDLSSNTEYYNYYRIYITRCASTSYCELANMRIYANFAE